MSARLLYLPLILGALFALSGISTARVHHVALVQAAPGDAGVSNAEAPVAPGDPADYGATLMKWLGIAYALANALNNFLPWPDKAKHPKLYALRYGLDKFTMLPHGTVSVPWKATGPKAS